MTLAQLSRLCSKPALWLDPLAAAMMSHWISEGNRQAFFLAACLFESNGFLHLSENMSYSSKGLLRVFPAHFTDSERDAYAGNPEAIANRVYANRNGNGDEASGDGWRYRGRGIIQLTGRANFARAEAASGLPLVAQPESLEQPQAACEVAAWFWAENGGNDLADVGDFEGSQGMVNRGSRFKIAENMPGRNDWLRKVQDALA